MRNQSASKENSAAPVMGMPVSKAPWRVAAVIAKSNYKLEVRFVDGLEGEVQMASLIVSSGAGVFSSLKDESLFGAVRVEHGAIVWPNGLDLAPDAMHRAISQTGCFRPGTDHAA
ncbi:MAG: hypothetical protein RL735_2002 [Pseudomonadota bacterium]